MPREPTKVQAAQSAARKLRPHLADLLREVQKCDLLMSRVAFSRVGGGSLISFGNDSWRQPFSDRLALLSTRIRAFDELLTLQSDAHESTFHQFLLDNPVLLDVYAEPVSKPRWHYPDGESPPGKAYVEPDFVLRYPDGSYRLVELERPNTGIAAASGQPKAELTQALLARARFAYAILAGLSRE